MGWIRTVIFVVLLASLALYISFRRGVIATLNVDGYTLPLTQGFELAADDPRDSDGKSSGLHINSRGSLGSGLSSPIDDVGRLAVKPPWIFGTSGKQYFMLDTSAPEPKPVFFNNEKALREAIVLQGLDPSPEFKSPEVLAAGVPDRQLHPQDYALMGNRMGWPDYVWSENAFFIGAMLAFLRGLLGGTRLLFREVIFLSLPLAFLVGLFFDGGGGPLMGDLIRFPTSFAVTAALGLLIRWIARRFFAPPIAMTADAVG